MWQRHLYVMEMAAGQENFLQLAERQAVHAVPKAQLRQHPRIRSAPSFVCLACRGSSRFHVVLIMDMDREFDRATVLMTGVKMFCQAPLPRNDTELSIQSSHGSGLAHEFVLHVRCLPRVGAQRINCEQNVHHHLLLLAWSGQIGQVARLKA
ncbi:hypothetical protein Poli38472_008267 [Pythium oligandrum]|uniref:Uncharacterized protein n=1 Tax=Pythium oligandrum TaxID=41045 RepID=A0A8K1FJ24_PYTOL|nr:hypothetical protein Poli38472_008267 [Pythium oligandrum]|eukprot:TMW65625.1 hypothetical protein Poli38472_008267 [Pythium oligandrum]